MLKSLDNTLMDATEKHKMSSRSLQTTSQLYALNSIREQFFKLAAQIIDESGSKCIKDGDGSIPKEVVNNPKKHTTRFLNKL